MDRTAKSLDVVTVGRSSVDLYGEQVGGRLEDMASFAKYIGGCPANIAVGTARLGLKSGLITRVGDEHMGRFIREQAAREGVDTRGVATDPERHVDLLGLESIDLPAEQLRHRLVVGSRRAEQLVIADVAAEDRIGADEDCALDPRLRGDEGRVVGRTKPRRRAEWEQAVGETKPIAMPDQCARLTGRVTSQRSGPRRRCAACRCS